MEYAMIYEIYAYTGAYNDISVHVHISYVPNE